MKTKVIAEVGVNHNGDINSKKTNSRSKDVKHYKFQTFETKDLVTKYALKPLTKKKIHLMENDNSKC